MKRDAMILLAVMVLFAAASRGAKAQTVGSKKFEVDGHFSSLSIDETGQTPTEPGFGGRFGYNLTDNIALEAEGDFFPRNPLFQDFRTGGRATEGLFGIKIGKRYKKFGIFAKARPGFVSFSEGVVEFFPTTATVTAATTFEVRTRRLTHFAADLGGVLEFYPTNRIFTRFDAGDTIIHYGQTTITTFMGTLGGPFTPTQFTLSSDTRHNFQFSAGVGFRF